MSVLSLRTHSRGLGLSPRRRTASSATPPGIVQDGLVAEWRFDDGEGGTLADYSGNGFHGALGAAGAAPSWTSFGLGFNLDDRVITPSLPAVEGVDIVFRSNTPISAAAGGRLLLQQIDDTGGSGMILGSWTGGIANEIMSLRQDTAHGYAALHRRAWAHASDSVEAGTWHLWQFDYQGGDPYYNLLLDGETKANLTQGTPEPWKAGIWSIGDSVTSAINFGLQGEIAYLIFYGTARSTAQQAQNRAALVTILGARGIMLP